MGFCVSCVIFTYSTYVRAPSVDCLTMVDVNIDDASFHSSSSSDDEYVASSRGGGLAGGQIDREALVRKKLLESFYGGGVSQTTPDNADDDADDANGSDDDTEDGGKGRMNANDTKSSANVGIGSTPSRISTLDPSNIPKPTKSDLDSSHFDAKSYTLSHIAHSTVETLLETNERLALDIRTLDSTMQTLVYENYSKFIDATDAIKSIGTNVSSVSGDSPHGLDRLRIGMERIAEASARSEELLRESRDAVAEKLRIQRLLTRLDALLSLPQTLRTYIEQSKYRMAVQSHMTATQILGRHSAGFESLERIELECGTLMTELASDLKKKLLDWSGSSVGNSRSRTLVDSGPKSIAEIFECARSALMLHPTPFSPGLDRGRCQSLALAACGQYLKDRVLVRGHSYSNEIPVKRMLSGGSSASDQGMDELTSELSLKFLDGILESTTLYGVSFEGSGPKDQDDAAGKELLQSFVSTNFGLFINNVRSHLIQESESKDIVGNRNSALVRGGDEEEESNDDANFRQLSITLSQLLRSVRELASGLALPEVGLDVSVASSLVDETVELAEILVRRRVAIKFNQLRSVVVKECLAPLVNQIIQPEKRTSIKGEEEASVEPIDDSESHEAQTLGEVIQLASVALSDGLQMADDLIRSLLQRSGASGGMAPVDSSVVKLAVQKSSKTFGIWFAAALEQLIGCEPSFEDKYLLEVWDEVNEAENGVPQRNKIILPQGESEERSSEHSISSYPTKIGDYLNPLLELVVQMENGTTERAYTNFLLAICEMCRLAERSMANTLNQSIQSAMEEDARVADSAKTLFGESINLHRKSLKDGLDSDHMLSRRFQLAASRSLAMYVMNRGAYAASELCNEMYLFSDARDPYAIPSGPRAILLNVFEIAKASCEDCISIVGGDLFVAPVAPFPEELEYAKVFGDRLLGNAGGGATSGLQLDVERMFIEKIQVYPHSLDQLEYTRNSVISGIFRVALSSLYERVRSSVFSSFGYRQMKVDVLFLRYIIPHYVKDEYGTPEQNACSSLLNTIDDIMRRTGQRCFEYEAALDDDYYDVEKDEIFTPYQLVQKFCDSETMNKVAFSTVISNK